MEKDANNRKTSKAIIEFANKCSPAIGLRIIEQYQAMPFVVKDAVDEFYETMDNVGDRDSIEDIKESLKQLADACEANPSYQDVYEAAKKEAQEAIADIIANEGLSLLSDE